MMEEQKGQKSEKNTNVLENGTYSIYGPETGDVMFDMLELHSGAGAKRVWKIESFSKEKIVFKVEKFG